MIQGENTLQQSTSLNSNPFKAKTYTALINLLLKQIRPSSYANFALIAVVAGFVYFIKQDDFVMLWFVLGYVLTALRLFILSKLEKAQASLAKIENAIVFLFVLSGLHWGLFALIYLNPSDTDIFPFLSAVFLAIVTANIPSMAPRPIAWLAYNVPITLSVIIQFALLGEWALVFMATVGQFLAPQVMLNLHKKIKHSITQDFRNAELLEEVSIAKEEAVKANLAKSKFLASASHDLRQPLHVQSILIEVLNLRLEDDENKQLVNKIAQSNYELNILFNALLEMSQLDAGTLKVHLGHHKLSTITNSLFDEYRILANQKGLSFQLTNQSYVIYSDSVLLKRVLGNLLSNALKFTETGTISVNVKNNKNTIEVIISDTGIGIDPTLHNEIFEEYVQIGNLARDRSKGIGLGLSLVKRLCQLLDHKIEVSSQLLKGAEFKITIPKGDEDKIISVIDSTYLNQLQGAKILLIDDEKDIVDAMSMMMRKWDAHVSGVESVNEALNLIDANNYQPDLIISDYRLNSKETGLDGLQLLFNKLGRDIPSLLITGDTDPALLEQVNKKGLYILHKPVKAQNLKKVINILLKG